MIENDDKLMMSDSIKGLIPDFDENQIKSFEDSFIIGTLELQFNEVVDLLSGTLIGFSLEKDTIKFDIRIKTSEAFNFFKNLENLSCRSIYMHLGNEEICLRGNYKISSPKMMDFDHKTKTCILGIDLFEEM